MAHWIINDKGFGGVEYTCSRCGDTWNDYYYTICWDRCKNCGEIIDEDANEYIEETRPSIFKPRKVKSSKKTTDDPVYVSYICNRKKCDFCDPDGPCYHTTDIRFAANFEEVAPGKWVEKEYDLNGG